TEHGYEADKGRQKDHQQRNPIDANQILRSDRGYPLRPLYKLETVDVEAVAGKQQQRCDERQETNKIRPNPLRLRTVLRNAEKNQHSGRGKKQHQAEKVWNHQWINGSNNSPAQQQVRPRTRTHTSAGSPSEAHARATKE